MKRMLAVFVCLFFASAPALAQQRIALLIGNQNYKPGVGQLENPFNDVKLVAGALRKVGFKILPIVTDASRAQILSALDLYASTLRDAGPDAIGFIYYSGHGIAVRGKNYLIPIEVERPTTKLLRAYGVSQSEILNVLQSEAPNAAHYLVIDACRNELRGARGGKGFIPVSQHNGTLIAFATAPGQTASDHGKGGGPYAKALATEIVKPGVPDLVMFHNVGVAVYRATDGDQVPWTLDGIRRAERVKFGGNSFKVQSEIPSTKPQPTPKKKRKPATPVLTGRKLIVQLQLLLLDRDCMDGNVGKVGKFDDATAGALRRFAKLSKTPFHWHRPTTAALKALRALPAGTKCTPVADNGKPSCINFNGDRFCR